MTRRSFSTDFKLEAVGLVLDQGYSILKACKSMGVGPTVLRRWVEQLRSERSGTTPPRSKAMTPEQKRMQDLEAQVRRLEREIEILKGGYRSLNVGLPRSISLIEALGEQYPRAELCRVFAYIAAVPMTPASGTAV